MGVAALKLSARDDDDDDDDDEGVRGGEGKRGGGEKAARVKQREVDEAFELFVGEGRGGGDGGGVITMETLRQVARVLKEDVSEEVLRDMVLEANGGKGVRAGVGRGKFGEVMRRAGVLR